MAGRDGLFPDDSVVIGSLLQRLRARDHVSKEEEQALRWALTHTRELRNGTTVTHEGEEVESCTLLLEGFLCRAKYLRDGQRQILELQVAGDFVDLHSFTLKRLDHNIIALGPCLVAMAPHDRLKRITEEYPHLTRLLWLTTNLDAAVHRTWVLSLGRRRALARVAHLFCELHARLQLVQRVSASDSYSLPLTQTDLSDCLGITPVHVNRTLQELRETGFADFRSGIVHIYDLGALRSLAEFDAQYLYLEQRPR